MMQENLDRFASRLRTLRMKAHLTQSELASKIGIGTVTVSIYESGKRPPSPEILIRLIKFFQVSADFLLGEDLAFPSMCIDLSALNERDRRTVRELVQILVNTPEK